MMSTYQKIGKIPQRKNSTSTKSVKSTASRTSVCSGKIGDEKGSTEVQSHLNPAEEALQKNLARLENAKYCCIFSSGRAAKMAILSLNQSGDQVILSEEIYAGTASILVLMTRFGVQHVLADTTNLDLIRKMVKSSTKMVFFESPSNPRLKVTDIKEIAKVVRKINPETLIVVDNTLPTCYFQKCMEFGADVTTSSLTKYLDGHGDASLGYVCTNHEDIFEKLQHLQILMGTKPSTYSCLHTMRSLKTLPLRMERHMLNSLKIAKHLETCPYVKKTIHPYLDSHPQHELALRETHGYSGFVSVILHGGEEEAKEFARNLKLFRVAPNIAEISSYVWLPYDGKSQKSSKSFIRLSIGVEDAEELIQDLDQAFIHAFKECNSQV